MKGKEEERRESIVRKILERYPNEKLDLEFETPFQLLVSAILAARSRDDRVNEATRELFKKYSEPEHFAKATPDELGRWISSINYWYKKAKTIIETAKIILEKFEGKVPDDLEKLTSIKGIGRKTANMILGVAFGKPAIITDTHVITVSQRLGLAESQKPEKIEQELQKIVPQKDWTRFSLALMRHGKLVCDLRKPKCEECFLTSDCTWFKSKGRQSKKKRKTKGKS